MKFVGDFHIHSHYSRATSSKLVPEQLDYWAKIKGIKIIGAGDFTHPGWLKELKEKRPGISIIVSGVTDIVQQCMYEAGLGPIHSLEYSLGTWGLTERLPDYPILKLLTMCGHAMIASDLVGKMVRDVKRGRRTVEDCCVEMAQCCTCGNYNVTRGIKVFNEILSTYMVHNLY